VTGPSLDFGASSERKNGFKLPETKSPKKERTLLSVTSACKTNLLASASVPCTTKPTLPLTPSLLA